MDKTRILKAEKRKQKQKNIYSCELTKRSRNSLTESSNVAVIFPNKCLLHEIEKKIVYANVSQKRNRGKLSQCLTFNASITFLEAAIKKKEKYVLIKIRDVDLIVKEAKYR